MKLREVKEILDANVVVGEEQLDMEVNTAFGADLMSDVMAFAKAGESSFDGTDQRPGYKNGGNQKDCRDHCSAGQRTHDGSY